MSRQSKWYEHQGVELVAWPPDGASLPGVRQWAPLCFFPEHIAAFDHLNDRQFRWAMRLLALCVTPHRWPEAQRPEGSVPLQRYEEFWKLVGAPSLKAWLDECKPVLDLFEIRADNCLCPSERIIAATLRLDDSDGEAAETPEPDEKETSTSEPSSGSANGLPKPENSILF